MHVFFALMLLLTSGLLLVCSITFRIVRLKKTPCSQILLRMQHVDIALIYSVATGQTFERDNAPDNREELLWQLGGIEGLQRLRYNARAMVDVARYFTLMKPDDDALARLIREDALGVSRKTLVLLWREKLGINSCITSVILQVALKY